MLQAACQQFLGKSEDDIKQVAQSTLEGHQRAIMAHMTVEVRIRLAILRNIYTICLFIIY